LIECSLIDAPIDLEQHVSLFDHRSFLEMNLVQITPHPGAHFDRIDGNSPAGEIYVVGNALFQGIADRDLGRLRWLFRGCPRASFQADREAQRQGECRTVEYATLRHVIRPFIKSYSLCRMSTTQRHGLKPARRPDCIRFSFPASESTNGWPGSY